MQKQLRKRMRKTVKAMILPVFTCLTLGVFTGCGRRPSGPASMPILVSVEKPRVMAVTNWDEYPGRLDAVEYVEVRPRVSGYVQSIHFQDGAYVREGDLLFVIDPRPYEAELQRVDAECRRLETALELARNDYARAEKMRAANAISEEEFDTRAKAVKQTESALDAARAARKAAELNLEYTHIKAPISGKISRRLVTVGNLVQGGGMVPGTLLTTIVSTDPIYCYFEIPEEAFARYRRLLSEHGSAGCNECFIGVEGEEGYPYKGIIDFYDNRVNLTTGTVTVRATVPNPDGRLVPGAYARVRIPAECIEGAVLVPELAVLSELTRKFVYVLGPDQIAQPRVIKVGRQVGMYRIVLEGLSPDDDVIVSGLMLVRPGVKVQVVPPGMGGGAMGVALPQGHGEQKRDGTLQRQGMVTNQISK